MLHAPLLASAALGHVSATAPAAPALVKLVWLIPLLPLAALCFLVFFARRLGGTRSGIVATAAMGGSFVASVLVWVGLRSMHGENRHYEQHLYTWLVAGGFHVELGFLVDPLAVTMCLFVTFVASLIFLYSIGYIHGDPDAPKFFVYLSFFALSMLVLVLGSNMLVTFLGWEGVGAASYLLIGYWFQDTANASAAKKAFITNRIGDWGFMTAMFFAFFAFGTLNYGQIFAHLSGPARSTLTAIVVLVLIGAIGKSAQLPLYVWLPDAMAGPTPVSALMHAATMVTAGVYLLVRMNPMIHAADPWVATLIAWVGAITALFAATVAISQRDIKKVLAYSTVSQLGYMVMACGSGAFVAAIFHMITHAFFKGLLFLGAGAVIHAMRGEQDMNWYGKLAKYLPWTCGTFIVAWLAIAGIPPFSGFWSKGDILGFAWHKSPALWAVGVFTALLTAYYMSREVYLTFFGEKRWADLEGEHGATAPAAEGEASEGIDPTEAEPVPVGAGAPPHVVHGAPVHPHEAPWVMRVPLVALAVGATVLGLLNLPFGEHWHVLDHWLAPSVAFGESTWHISPTLEWSLEIASVVLALLGIAAASAIYLRMKRERQLRFEPALLDKAWYYDLTVSAFMDGPGRKLYTFFAEGVEVGVIDGAVNGVGRLVRATGAKVRRVQTGYVRNYALGLAAGVVLLVAYTIVRGSF